MKKMITLGVFGLSARIEGRSMVCWFRMDTCFMVINCASQEVY